MNFFCIVFLILFLLKLNLANNLFTFSTKDKETQRCINAEYTFLNKVNYTSLIDLIIKPGNDISNAEHLALNHTYQANEFTFVVSNMSTLKTIIKTFAPKCVLYFGYNDNHNFESLSTNTKTELLIWPSQYYDQLLKDLLVTNLTGVVGRYFSLSKAIYSYLTGFLLIWMLSIGTIILASTFLIWEIYQVIHYRRELANARQSKCAKIARIIVLGCLPPCSLLLFYFFYDIFVYFAMAVFCISGAWSLAFNTSIIVNRYSLKINNWSYTVLVPRFSNAPWSLKLELPIFLFPIGLAITLTWFFYRNVTGIGWPLQDAIAVSLVAYFLFSIGSILSMKWISIIFLFATLYDLCAVFITPLFMNTQTQTEPMHALSRVARFAYDNVSMGNSSGQTEGRQQRQSERPISVMESVALGKAGSSGELLPAMWLVNVTSVAIGLTDQCALAGTHSAIMLGFGDTFIPGLMSAFLAIYDASHKLRCLPHFCMSIVGYVVGGVLVVFVNLWLAMAQPALIFLCPSVFIFVILTALYCGDLKRLWLSELGVLDSKDESASVLVDMNLDVPCETGDGQADLVKASSYKEDTNKLAASSDVNKRLLY